MYVEERKPAFRVDSHFTARRDTTRQDKVFCYGFYMLEFTFVRHRKLTTKTVSLGLREENILPVC
jgi:hypothetical protein